LNYVGERLAPDVWKDERNNFRREPYRGLEGKIRKVLELVGFPWQPTTEPLKTILELKSLRDLIAHGKAEKRSGEIVHAGSGDMSFPASTLQRMVGSRENLKQVLSKVENFLNQIHQLAIPKVDPREVWFGVHPLLGPLSTGSHSTELCREEKV
jgi:hypothetical protein